MQGFAVSGLNRVVLSCGACCVVASRLEEVAVLLRDLPKEPKTRG